MVFHANNVDYTGAEAFRTYYHHDSRDARRLLCYMVGCGSLTAEQRLQADIDGNTRVDTSDVRAVLAMAVTDGELIPVSTTTAVTTTTTKASLDDDGYYDDIVRP